jgi:vacuolar protein sorting-associated protein 18
MLDLQSQLSLSSAPSRPHRRNLVEDTQNQGLKLAAASVQGLDQLRKLVLPDALLGIIGGAIPGKQLMGRVGGPFGGGSDGVMPSAAGNLSASAKKEAGEKQGLREALDELLASSCVLCEGAITSVDRGFVDEGEEM